MDVAYSRTTRERKNTSEYIIFASPNTEKKSALNESYQNGFVDLKKLPNELKCQKNLTFKYTEP